MTGSIWLRDNVNLHLNPGAVIKGSPELKDYCDENCCSQNEAEIKGGDYISGGHLIMGVGVRNVSITGQGRIDGNSDAFMLDENGKLCLDRAGLTAFAHGEYYALGEVIGKFGFSVAKENRKKPMGQSRSKPKR